MKLRDYQADAVAQIYSDFKTYRKILLCMATGAGKCLAPDTRIMMYDGTCKLAKDVVVGDVLINEKSEPVRVLETVSGKDVMYRITPIKGGGDFTCTQDHILTLRSGGVLHDVRLVDYLKPENKSKYRTFKYCYSGIEINCEKKFEIDPYTMGAWIGDGSSYHATLYCPDTEVCKAFSDSAMSFGIKTNMIFRDGCYCVEAYVKKDGLRENPFWRALSKDSIDTINGKNVKKIPERYLRTNRKNRLELLAGIIDTDGYLGNGYYEICQKHEGLAHQIVWLCRSLGYMVKKTNKPVNEVMYYRISVSGDFHDLPCRVHRKIAPPRKINKHPLSTGFSVELIGFGEYAGFRVEGGRFLLDDFTVTHNSETVTYIVRDALEDNVPVVMVVRGRELVENLSKRLLKYKIDHSVFMADHYRYDPRKLVQVCSIDTLNSRKRYPFVDRQCLVVLDEAHKNYDEIFDNYKTQMILGMTATPFQNQWNFDHVIKPIESYELRDNGSLVPDKIFCPNIVDTSNVKIVAGDFQRDAIEDLMSQSQIVGNIVDDYIELGESRPAVCFAVSVEHSKLLAKRFNDSGISAMHCDAKSSPEEREKAHKGILDGSINVICNVDIFSVGWDCPPISCVILARPTWSTIWYLQAVGRGLRSHPGKNDCIILDNAGNVFRHGGPYRIREISLEKPEKGKKKKREMDESITTCKECYLVFPSEEKCCPDCGWTRPPRQIKQIDGKLTEYQESPEQKQRALNVKVQVEYHKLEYIQRTKGLKPNFAFYKIKEKFGNDGLKALEKYLCKSLPAFLYK